jgi:hypothetical protein
MLSIPLVLWPFKIYRSSLQTGETLAETGLFPNQVHPVQGWNLFWLGDARI